MEAAAVQFYVRLGYSQAASENAAILSQPLLISALDFR
jgi:hypothetical protein